MIFAFLESMIEIFTLSLWTGVMIYYTNIYSILHTEKSDIINKHGMTLIHSTLSIGYRES